jgi:hypothetical protein
MGWTEWGMVGAIELMRRRLMIVTNGSSPCRCESRGILEGLGGPTDGEDRTRGFSNTTFLGGHLLGPETG